MSILQLPLEQKEVQRINNKRVREEERKKRIFNSNYQVYVDSEALKSQVYERKRAEIQHQRVEEAFQQHENNTFQLAAAIAEETDKRRRQLNQEIIKYQQIYQRPESRREFDLNDPDFLKKSKPARTSDDDPSLTASSAQIFEGEDRSLHERRKRQAEQLKEWLEQQIVDRKQAIEYERKSHQEYTEYLLERSRRATQLDRLEQECNRHMQRAIRHYNAILAEERKVEKQKLERQNIENDQAEIINTANSDLLTEPLEIGFMSAFGPGRINCPMYKGMTPEMIRGIRETQRLQREEKRKQKEEEEKNERQWQDLMESQAKQAVEESNFIQQKQRELRQKLAGENKLLSHLQEDKLNNFNKYINVNVPTIEYFNKFNISSR